MNERSFFKNFGTSPLPACLFIKVYLTANDFIMLCVKNDDQQCFKLKYSKKFIFENKVTKAHLIK